MVQATTIGYLHQNDKGALKNWYYQMLDDAGDALANWTSGAFDCIGVLGDVLFLTPVTGVRLRGP